MDHLLGVVHVHMVQLVGDVVVTLLVVGGDGLGGGPTQKKTVYLKLQASSHYDNTTVNTSHFQFYLFSCMNFYEARFSMY